MLWAYLPRGPAAKTRRNSSRSRKRFHPALFHSGGPLRPFADLIYGAILMPKNTAHRPPPPPAPPRTEIPSGFWPFQILVRIHSFSARFRHLSLSFPAALFFAAYIHTLLSFLFSPRWNETTRAEDSGRRVDGRRSKETKDPWGDRTRRKWLSDFLFHFSRWASSLLVFVPRRWKQTPESRMIQRDGESTERPHGRRKWFSDFLLRASRWACCPVFLPLRWELNPKMY